LPSREREPQLLPWNPRSERHPRELVGDGLDHLGMPDARAVDAVAAEAVDVRAAREVLERRALAGPLERRIVPHLDHGLAVLEVAAVVVEVEVVDGVCRDLLLLLGRQLLGRDDVQPALGFLDQFLRVHVRPRFCVETIRCERIREPRDLGG
jgi:hypothetical protein